MERSVWARELVSAAALLVKQRSLFWFKTTEGEKDYLVSHTQTRVGSGRQQTLHFLSTQEMLLALCLLLQQITFEWPLLSVYI